MRFTGLALALAVYGLDRASKWAVLDWMGLKPHEVQPLAPWFNVTLLWNPGISYSLLRASTPAGRWGLFAVTAAAAVLMSVWLWRTSSRVSAAALGLLIGGAVGNGQDRLLRGAVADWADVHLGAWHWYVFNLADGAIVVGVALLLYEGLLARGRT